MPSSCGLYTDFRFILYFYKLQLIKNLLIYLFVIYRDLDKQCSQITHKYFYVI